MSLPYDPLNWLQNGEFAEGGLAGDSQGALNRPLTQLLENDRHLQQSVDNIETSKGLSCLIKVTVEVKSGSLQNVDYWVNFNIHEETMQISSGQIEEATMDLAVVPASAFDCRSTESMIEEAHWGGRNWDPLYCGWRIRTQIISSSVIRLTLRYLESSHLRTAYKGIGAAVFLK